MSIANNISRLREKYGLTQAELGEIAGVTDRAVSAWEKGIAEPRMGAVQKIADHFKIPKSAVVDDQPSLFSKTTLRGIRIPVLGKVAAGIPIDAVEDILDYEEITPNMAAQGEHFGLMIKGNSMEPRMCEGDVVIVRQQPDCDSGDVAIVMINGDEATCKKVMKYENGSIALVSNNSAYPPMVYTPEQAEQLPIRIIGKVVELRGKF